MRLIVDSHVHLYRAKSDGKAAQGAYEVWEYGAAQAVEIAEWDGDVDDALAAMESAAAEYAVVVNLLDGVPHERSAGDALVAFNEWLCDEAETHPQFVPCVGVDPRLMPIADLVTHIQRMVTDRRAVGVKLHPSLHRLDLADERFWPVFDLCQALGIRVISHCGPSRDTQQYAEPNAFRPVMEAFPDLRLVLAHVGGGAWSQVVKLANDYPQVHFDTSEITHWVGTTPAAPTPEEFVTILRGIGIDRVMMGSDFPWYDIARTVALMDALPLTESENRAVLGENAARFFGINHATSRNPGPGSP